MKQNFPHREHTVGELLFRYMHQYNLNENEFAKKIKVSSRLLENWLNGKGLKYKYVFKIIYWLKLSKEQQKELLLSANALSTNKKSPFKEEIESLDGGMSTFKYLFNHYMEEKDIKAANFARKIGVAKITIDRWRNGSTGRPGCESVNDIALELNLTDEERDQLLLSAGCRPIKPPRKPFENNGKDDIPLILDRPEMVPIPGLPISHPSQFFGQIDVLKRIRRAWQQPLNLQHVAVIGERRSGKTSLLKYLQHIATVPSTDLRPDQPQGWNQWMPHNFQFAFVDFQRITMSKPESLIKNILKQLNLEAPEPCDLMTFSEVLEDELDKPTIILMDEVGAGLQSPDLDRVFWSNLRSLGSIGQLGLVITAHEPIHTLAKDSNKESPFFNIFGHTMHLGALTETEALELINGFSHLISVDDANWLLQKSGGWATLLQILCDERIVALEENDASDRWKTIGLERIKPFSYLLKK